MKVLKKIGLILGALAAVFLLAACFIDGDYHISRSIEINLPKEEVYSYVLHLENQREYSVWELKDPNAKHTYTGKDGTVGFISAWDSDNEEVGKGEQEIIAIGPNRIDYELRFYEPFEATDNAYMEITSDQPGRSTVRWGFEGKMPYPSNFFMLFMDMDEMLGGDLQKGLENLKFELE